MFGSGVSSVWEFQKTLIILFFSRQVMMLSCIPRLCSSHCILGRRHGLGQRKCYCASDPFWILEPLMSSDGPQQKPFASGCSLCSVGCAGFGVSGQAGRAHSEAHAGGNLRIRGDIIHWPSPCQMLRFGSPDGPDCTERNLDSPNDMKQAETSSPITLTLKEPLHALRALKP